MAFVLRIDVDKPYGTSNLLFKIISKLKEDYFFPSHLPGYLKSLKLLIRFLEKNNITSHIYFRICTLPSIPFLNKILSLDHKIGLHAENTRSIDTLKIEIETMNKKLNISNSDHLSFSKHGSGILKLGKNHYAPYEPEKYIKWANQLKTTFPFGNKNWSGGAVDRENSFFSDMYWINSEYHTESQPNLDEICKEAKLRDIIIIIHPSNYESNIQIQNDFEYLVKKSKELKVTWKTI